MQGRAAGVSVVTNSGQPGSEATVRVRGITSFGAGSNDPLWIVDGIVVDDIAFLNQSDIENIEILKDGASAAIYGVSAAKGVVLVTTKKGKKGTLNFNYNGAFGIGSASKKLDLLNATQYATIMNEAYANDGNTTALFNNPSSYGEGTDWQDIIFNAATRTSHDFNISGGNDRSTFYSSFGYFGQDGIVMSDISYYKRMNFRLNSTHKVFDFLTIGQTFSYTHEKSQGINSNDEYGGPLSSAVNLDPITPAVVTDWSKVNPDYYTSEYIVKDANGNPYGISQYVNQEMTNPLAFKYTQLGHYNWADNFVGNVFADLKLHKNITFRTSLNGKLAYWGYKGFTPLYYLSPNYQNTTNNNLNRVDQRKLEWNIENTVTYKNNWGEHNFSLLLGQGYYEYDISHGESITYSGLPITDWKDASFNFDISNDNIASSAWDGIRTHKASYFGRLIYDYDNRYLLTATMRRDGSSKFGPDHHWGNFPSASIGWNVSNESFWPENNIINTLKLRGGYGVLGNDNFDNFKFASFVSGGSNYTNGNGSVVTGYAPSTLENPDLHWEETKQLNIGADIKFLKNFDLSIDFFNKKTTDILRQVSIPGYVGVTSNPWANIGDMENKGLELNLSYKKTWGDFKFNATGNFSLLKNEITKLEDNLEYVDYARVQPIGAVARLAVGYSYGSFFGYKTNGIFQNWDEINTYVNSSGSLIQPNAQPGDFKWIDANGDGEIDDDDKIYLGNSVPKYTLGLTINMSYKNWDFMAFAQGQGGNKLFQGLRRLDIPKANYQTSVLERWTGEGSSYDTPRVTFNDPNGNYNNVSDYYLSKGDYVRLKIVQIGYTLPKEAVESFGASKLRFYLTGENLFTFTKYTGYDPEIASGDSYGIDRGYYPQARTFLLGVNVQF